MFSLCRFPETSLSGIDHKTRALAKWTSGALIGSPRPNLKSSRLSISGDRPTTPTRTSLSPLFKPTRTLSQPNLMEPNISAAPRPDARAISPYTPRPSDVRPTRIHIPRTRSQSTSRHAQATLGAAKAAMEHHAQIKTYRLTDLEATSWSYPNGSDLECAVPLSTAKFHVPL